MVCLEKRMRCLFLLVMFLAVHHCIFHQPPNEVKNETLGDKNRSRTPTLKQICDNILPLQLADPNNKTFGRVPACAENITTSSPVTNLTSSSDNQMIKAPSEFPQNESNGTKIVIANTTQVVLQLKNTTNNADVTVGKEEASVANATVTEDKMVVAANSVNISLADGNDINRNNSRNATNLQNEKGDTEVPEAANVTNVETPIPRVNITEKGNNSSKVDTEVGDLLNSTKCLTPSQIPDSPPNITYNATQNIDKETELIEDGQNTEDVLRNSTAKEKFSSPGVPLVQGQLAAILAGVFVVISVTAYVGLLSWRRYLENRYGNRQMLVNEDEFNDDLRHFSI